MPEQVRFNIDAHQLRIVVGVMQSYLSEPPRGELHHFMHSIIAQQCVTLERKLLLRRLEYRLYMPTHFAIAFRRMVSVGMEVLPEGTNKTAMRMLMAEVDPVVSSFLDWQ